MGSFYIWGSQDQVFHLLLNNVANSCRCNCDVVKYLKGTFPAALFFLSQLTAYSNAGWTACVASTYVGDQPLVNLSF